MNRATSAKGITRPRAVLAFSGSVASSAAVSWLAEQYAVDVITVTLDLGQSGDPVAVRSSALALGARRAHLLDAREEFARDCIVPALRRGDPPPPRAVLAAPLLARKLAEVAAIEEATLVAHAGDQVDHAAVAAAIREVAPHLGVIAAAVEWNLGPSGLEAYATSRGVIFPPSSHATRRAKAVDVPAHLEVTFDHGVPVAVNGVSMTLTELIESVGTIAGTHAIGGSLPIMARTMYEAPVASVLARAHHALVAGASDATGIVCLKLFQGEQIVVAATPLPLSLPEPPT